MDYSAYLPSMAQKRFLAVLVPCLLLFALVVWPTRYRMDNVNAGGSPITMRTDRLTGKTEYLTRSGWRPLGGVEMPATSAAGPDCTPEQMRTYQTDPYMHLLCHPPR